MARRNRITLVGSLCFSLVSSFIQQSIAFGVLGSAPRSLMPRHIVSTSVLGHGNPRAFQKRKLEFGGLPARYFSRRISWKLGSQKEATPSKITLKHVEEATMAWVKRVVIGLNLCPWAMPTLKDGKMRIQVSQGQDHGAVLREVRRCVRKLASDHRLGQTREEGNPSTVLFVCPQKMLARFEVYLDFVEMVQEMLEEEGLQDVLQVATFHPHYQFAEHGKDDVENFTNRSPYPILHFLLEDEVSEAVDNYSDTDKIWQRNIQSMQKAGTAEMKYVCSH